VSSRVKRARRTQDGEQHFVNDLEIPLTPSLSPNGGEGVRRTGEGGSRVFCRTIFP